MFHFQHTAIMKKYLFSLKKNIKSMLVAEGAS